MVFLDVSGVSAVKHKRNSVRLHGPLQSYREDVGVPHVLKEGNVTSTPAESSDHAQRLNAMSNSCKRPKRACVNGTKRLRDSSNSRDDGSASTFQVSTPATARISRSCKRTLV
jgi:hypothetical protein